MTPTRLGAAALALAALALGLSIAGRFDERPAEPVAARPDPARADLEREIAELRRELEAVRAERAVAAPAPAGDDGLERILARLTALEVEAAREPPRTASPAPFEPARPSSEPVASAEEKRRAMIEEVRAVDARHRVVRDAIVRAGVSEEAAAPLAREVARWETGLAEVRAREGREEDVLAFQDSVRSHCRRVLSPPEYEAFLAGFPHLAGRESDRVDPNPPPAMGTVPPVAPPPPPIPAGQERR